MGRWYNNLMNVIVRDATIEDAGALAHVLISAGNATFTGLVPDVCMQFTEAESKVNWQRGFTEGFGPDTFLLAAQLPAGPVIGYAMGGAFEGPVYRGELKQLQVLPEYQKRGIGRLLVYHVVQRLAAQGITSMIVGVLRINPNRAFYERLGGEYLYDRTIIWEGLPFPESMYGWKDTSPLRNDP